MDGQIDRQTDTARWHNRAICIATRSKNANEWSAIIVPPLCKKRLFATGFASALSFALRNDETMLLSPDAFYDLKLKVHQNVFATGDPSRTPLGELTALPQTIQLDLRGKLRNGWKGERKS